MNAWRERNQGVKKVVMKWVDLGRVAGAARNPGVETQGGDTSL